MLTFPALNGLGLALTGDAGTSAKAAAMLPMIAVNGVLCFAAVVSARMLGRVSKLTAFALGSAALLAWLGAAWVIPPLKWAWHMPLLLIFVAWGWVWSRRTWPMQPSPTPVVTEPWWTDRWLWAFSAILGLLLLVAEVWGSYHEAVGKASALPLLPLFGLASQMTRGPGALERFRGTVLFGPALAIGFVMAASFLIQHDVLTAVLPVPRAVSAMLYVALGWLMCIKTIELIAERAERGD